jgi:acyl-CoA thioester hydrolase
MAKAAPASKHDAGRPADHRYCLRVFYEDTDTGGVVYYANYLKFAERARTEFLRDLDIHQSAMLAGGGPVFAVRRVEADFAAPAHLDDELEVRTWVTGLSGARIEMDQNVCRDGHDLVRLSVEIVCVNGKGRAARIPRAIADNFTQAMAGRSD